MDTLNRNDSETTGERKKGARRLATVFALVILSVKSLEAPPVSSNRTPNYSTSCTDGTMDPRSSCPLQNLHEH